MRPKSSASHLRRLRGLDNAIVINTCAVTGEAVRQAAADNPAACGASPDARIVVTGCAAQIEPETFADMPEVDHVIGNAEKLEGKTFERLAAG
jgi:threonylcarbamoyladenosine tRNA methylthiotransferase MtaB